MVTVSYSPSIVTMALCCSISKVKQDIGLKFRRYVYSFWHDPRTWQSDRRTDTAWRHIPRLYIASRGKNRHFMYPSLHLLFSLGTPLRQSRNTLHKWKDNSVLAKPVAACTHLSSTLSQLFEPQVQKIAVFTYRSPHFCFPSRRPCDYHAICCMDGKTIKCQPVA